MTLSTRSRATTSARAPKPSSKKSKDAIEVHALRRTLHLLRPHIPRHRWLVLVGLVALLADVVFRVLEPWPMKYALDAVSQALGAEFNQRTGLGLSVSNTIIASALSLMVIVTLRALANYGSTVAFALVGARVATELRSRVFDHLQRLSLRYHSKASIGDTSQRLVGDVGRLQEVAVTAGLPLIGNILTLAVLMVVMVWLDPMLSIIVVIAAVGYFLLSRVSAPDITKASRSTRKGEGALVGSASEALGAMRVVQSYNLENQVAKGFTDGNARAMKAGVKARRLAAGLERSTDVVVGLAQGAVISVGSFQVLKGAITPGDLVLFVMYLKIAMKPLRDMAKYTGRIARATASGERIADLMDEDIEITDPAHPVPLTRAEGALSLRRIIATDGHGRRLYNSLNLDIPAGQKVGLLGPSGGGKSTLVSYLLRLAEPESGQVQLDGRDIRDHRLADLRQQFAVVLQESVLFATSLRENIRFGRIDATDAEVEDAARQAGIHEFITSLPQGYDTELGLRGDTLSGGQRQRVAIARAMLRDAPIVVLDEATTGLDPASKALVEQSLRGLQEGRTSICVTHDLAAIAGLDRVLWLERGRILEDGHPRELAADPDSRFARWLREQEDAEGWVSGEQA